MFCEGSATITYPTMSSRTQVYSLPHLDCRDLMGARAERNVRSVSYSLGLRVCSGSLAMIEPLQLVTGDGMTLREENLLKLKSLSLPMGVLAVVGPFHSGKSFPLMQNGLTGLNKQDEFPESNLTDEYVEDMSALSTSLGDSLNVKQVRTPESRLYLTRHMFAFLQLVGRRLRAHFSFEILEIGVSLAV